MAYSAEISRTNPTCFLFLVDQSSSMLEPFGAQPEKQKAQGVGDAINRLFQNLVLKCAKSEGIRDYFYVGLIGYGGRVTNALGGALADKRIPRPFSLSPPRCRRGRSGSGPRGSRFPYSAARHLRSGGRRRQPGSSARC